MVKSVVLSCSCCIIKKGKGRGIYFLKKGRYTTFLLSKVKHGIKNNNNIYNTFNPAKTSTRLHYCRIPMGRFKLTTREKTQNA